MRAVENALGITIPDNARLLRNLLEGAQFIQDHVVHFYHLHALDWVDIAPGVKSEVINWVLKKPSLDHRIAIDQSIARALTALPHLLAGDMDKATMLVHTSKPPRPKPPKPDNPAT